MQLWPTVIFILVDNGSVLNISDILYVVHHLLWVFAEALESFNYQLKASDLLNRSAQILSLEKTYGTS